MTNRDYINSLTNEQMAMLLINQCFLENDGSANSEVYDLTYKNPHSYYAIFEWLGKERKE